MKLNKNDWKKIIIAALQWGVIGAAGIVLLTAQTMYKNSELGKKSYEQQKRLNIKVDSVCNVMNVYTVKQEVINNTTIQRINQMSEDISDTKHMVEQLYINLLEKNP